MIVSIFTINNNTTVELKTENKYAVVNGNEKGFPILLLVKCLIKLLTKKNHR